MLKLRAFIKRHVFLTALVAVCLPLLMILGVHYALVVKLRTTTLNDRLVPGNFLEAVATDVEYLYRNHGEEKLSLSPIELSEQNLDSLGNRFNKTRGEARVYFVAIFAEGREPRVMFYNSQPAPVTLPPNSPEEFAVREACASWQARRANEQAWGDPTLAVDEHDSANRIILKPVIDESQRVRGVAGMIVDSSYFTNEYLPQTIRKHFQRFFPERSQNNPIITTEDLVASADNLTVAVRDRHDNVLLATRTLENSEPGVTTPFRFIFTDWSISVHSRFRTPEQAVMNAVDYDLLFSIVMILVVIAAVTLTLRTALREMKLSQMKADFVSNVSHELRTPLSSIRMFGEFLKLGWIKEGDQIRKCGEYIEAESRRLTHLINNILDFSKIESAQKSYEFEETDIKEVVAGTVQTLEVQLRQIGFTINFKTLPEPLTSMTVDREAIAQMLMNLVYNAVKYSQSAKEVLIQLGQEGNYITISVTDYGRGIPRNEQSKIFDKFYRVSTGLLHDVKGSGLGLSIVKHIVEAHQGHITVESRSGKGSTFTIHLPKAKIMSDRSSADHELLGSANALRGTEVKF